MNFEERLERAIERGRHTKAESGRKAAARQLSEAEMRNLHSTTRVSLAEHLDACLRAVVDRFPGFQLQTVANDSGWGSRILRDDVRLRRGTAETAYTRLEMLIRPFSSTHVIELTAKATVRNREIYNRSHYQRLDEVDEAGFQDLIDLWVVEFAELYASE